MKKTDVNKPKTIVISGIRVLLSRKRIKNMYIRVLPPDGAVCVSAPYFASDSEIDMFVCSHFEWIQMHTEQILAHEAAKPPVNEYKNGERVELLGVFYPLRVVEAKRSCAVFEDDTVILYVKPKSTLDDRAHLIRKLYIDVLRGVLPELIEKDEAIVNRHAEEWRFREMKTRWGVCNVQKRRITLNTRLAMRPKECIDYVIIHELTHLIEKSHNAVFKAYLDRFCPDWRNIRKCLNGK